jgi:ABC-type proline/glycine betaine transport system permease subunit
MSMLDRFAEAFATRGDLAHIALFAWAVAASALVAVTVREIGVANRRFDDLIRELAQLNRLFTGDDP